MHSETNPDRTKFLEKEVDNLKEKTNFLEDENNALKLKMTRKWKMNVYVTKRTSLEKKSILKKLRV